MKKHAMTRGAIMSGVDSLRKVPPFSLFSDEQFSRIRKSAEELKYSIGETILEEDAENRFFHYILDGGVEVFIDSGKKKVKKVSELHRGSWFGETSIVTRSKTIALVKALSDTKILRIGSEVFTVLLGKNPDARKFFDDYAQLMHIRNRLYRTPLFANENDANISHIINKLTIRKYKKGAEIIRQGEEGHEFFILWEGSVDVYLDVPDNRKKITTIYSPNSFGELSLVSDRPRANSVYAKDEVTVYVLNKGDFLSIVKKDFSLFNRLCNQIYERQRPVKSEEITVSEEWKGRTKLFVLRQDVTGQYLRLDEKAFFILNEMDGTKSIQEIAVSYFQKFQEIGVGSLLQLLPMLIEKGFVEIPELRKEMKNLHKTSLTAMTINMLRKMFFINLVSFPAERLVRKIYAVIGQAVFSKFSYALMSLISIAGLCAFIYGSVTGFITPGGVTTSGFIAFIIMFLVHGVFHEIAHALTAVRYGVKIGDFGIGIFLLVFIMPHVRTTDMWMIDKGQRIVVSWAGPFMTAFVSGIVSIGVFIFPLQYSADLSMFALVGYLIILTSLNPLILSDGYYMLMDFFQMPGLRFKSVRFIRFGLGKAINSGFRKEHWIFSFYSIFSLFYIMMVLLYTAVDIRPKLGDYLLPLLGGGAALVVSYFFVAIIFILSLLSVIQPLFGITEEGKNVL
jgi:CRP-like cAMP-binding protein